MRTAKMASEKKQYGLIIPNRRKIIGPAKAPKPSVFADESSSDEEGVRTSVECPYAASSYL